MVSWLVLVLDSYFTLIKEGLHGIDFFSVDGIHVSWSPDETQLLTLFKSTSKSGLVQVCMLPVSDPLYLPALNVITQEKFTAHCCGGKHMLAYHENGVWNAFSMDQCLPLLAASEQELREILKDFILHTSDFKIPTVSPWDQSLQKNQPNTSEEVLYEPFTVMFTNESVCDVHQRYIPAPGPLFQKNGMYITDGNKQYDGLDFHLNFVFQSPLTQQTIALGTVGNKLVKAHSMDGISFNDHLTVGLLPCLEQLLVVQSDDGILYGLLALTNEYMLCRSRDPEAGRWERYTETGWAFDGDWYTFPFPVPHIIVWAPTFSKFVGLDVIDSSLIVKISPDLMNWSEHRFMFPSMELINHSEMCYIVPDGCTHLNQMVTVVFKDAFAIQAIFKNLPQDPKP